MAKRQLFICVENAGYEASLERRKIYEVLADTDSAKRGLLRVVDESGEDYLYPESMFVEACLPAAIRRAVLHAA
jgi:hypothetical protein